MIEEKIKVNRKPKNEILKNTDKVDMSNYQTNRIEHEIVKKNLYLSNVFSKLTNIYASCNPSKNTFSQLNMDEDVHCKNFKENLLKEIEEDKKILMTISVDDPIDNFLNGDTNLKTPKDIDIDKSLYEINNTIGGVGNMTFCNFMKKDDKDITFDLGDFEKNDNLLLNITSQISKLESSKPPTSSLHSISTNTTSKKQMSAKSVRSNSVVLNMNNSGISSVNNSISLNRKNSLSNVKVDVKNSSKVTITKNPQTTLKLSDKKILTKPKVINPLSNSIVIIPKSLNKTSISQKNMNKSLNMSQKEKSLGKIETTMISAKNNSIHTISTNSISNSGHKIQPEEILIENEKDLILGELEEIFGPNLENFDEESINIFY